MATEPSESTNSGLSVMELVISRRSLECLSLRRVLVGSRLFLNCALISDEFLSEFLPEAEENTAARWLELGLAIGSLLSLADLPAAELPTAVHSLLSDFESSPSPQLACPVARPPAGHSEKRRKIHSNALSYTRVVDSLLDCLSLLYRKLLSAELGLAAFAHLDARLERLVLKGIAEELTRASVNSLKREIGRAFADSPKVDDLP